MVANTEDKASWCEQYGEDVERGFTVGRLYELGLAGHLNLSKRQDKYTHDLFVSFPADLKTVRTPLYKAQELYGVDPQYAVTFNCKDAARYRSLYPSIVVIFDVRWENCAKDLGGRRYSVDDMHLTAAGFLTSISEAVRRSGNRVHTYGRRVNDTAGNAKDSWVFDIRHLQELGDSAPATARLAS